MRAVVRRVRACQVALIIIVISVAAPLRTLAQVDFSAGLDAALQQDFLRRDLIEIQTGLKLDETQVPILETFFQDYEEAFQRGVESVRMQVTKLRPAIGANDPQLDQRRNDIRDRVANLVQEAQKLHENMPEGMTEEEFQRQFRQKAEQLRDELKLLQGEPLTPEAIRQIMDATIAKIDQWQVEKTRLRDQFIANLKSIITPEQDARWPALQQKFTRDKTLSLGRLAGESVDLFSIVRELKLSDEDQSRVQSTLSDYAVRLDDALTRRNDFIQSSQRKVLQAMKDEDRTSAESAIEREVQLRIAVRQVNEEFAGVIASQLSAELGSKFTQRYRERGYPQVYRSSSARRLLDAAVELQGLDAQTRESVKSIRDACVSEAAATNEQLLTTVRSKEPEQFKANLLRRWIKDGEATPENSIESLNQAFAKRQDLEARYVRQLQSVLTPEQYNALPAGYRISVGSTVSRSEGG